MKHCQNRIIFTNITLMHKFTNYNSTLIQSQTNACRSARGSVGLMGEKNTVHLLKKFQMTVCQYTICTAADCSNLQNRRLMWNWATYFLPGLQIDQLMISQRESFTHAPLWNFQMPSYDYPADDALVYKQTLMLTLWRRILKYISRQQSS